jgi:hypothetical protein
MAGKRILMRLKSLSVLFCVLVVLAVSNLSAPAKAQIGVGVSVSFGPPALPVYDQPVCPGDGYIWTPGYWAWDGDDYYWVPGTWVLAPEVGYLWTPPWWGWENGAFFFHQGWWGPTIGFYGGIDYGFGYFGTGFAGGRWEGGHFFYNRAVMNVNVVNIHNVYNETVVNRVTVNHVSYNGGAGGINARPTPQEEAAERGPHQGPVAAQNQHMEQARGDPQLKASANHGKPPIAATDRPGEFKGHAVAAKEAGAPYHPPAERGGEAAGNRGAEAGARPENGARAVHPNELPAAEHAPAPNTGNAKLDQKYQKQQNKLYAKQQQDRQKLQQKQDREHQQAAQRNASAAEKQQMEQRHQQQTQQMQQRHVQQQQHLQARQQPHEGGKPR